MENNQNGGAQSFLQKAQPVWDKTCDICGAIGRVLKIIWNVLVRLRKIFMAVPVVMAAMYLAQLCRDSLGRMYRFHILDVLASFEQASLVIREVEVTRDVAVYGPLIVTGACLVLMFFSRRSVFPWLISIFSLAIPVFILLTGFLPT